MPNSKVLRPLVLLLAILLIGSDCSTSPNDCSEDGELDTYASVALKFRVEVKDTQAAPVEGAEVRIEHFKYYCNGDTSEHRSHEGVTGSEGIFSTELAVTHPTYVISHNNDAIRIVMDVQKGDWTAYYPELWSGDTFYSGQQVDLFIHYTCRESVPGQCERTFNLSNR